MTDYTDDTGTVHVIGTVHNGTDTYQDYVKVSGTLYDKAGNVLDSPFTYTTLDKIPPGGDAPFDLTSSNATGLDHYKLGVESQDDSSYTPPTLKLSGLDSHVDDADTLHVTGEIANNGSGPTTYNEAVCTFFDKSKAVVGVGFTYTSQDTLQPGESSSFDCTTDHNVNQVDTYEVQVTAQ